MTMLRRIYAAVALLVLIMAATSCSDRIDKERKILQELIGREIALPDGLECRILDTPVDYDMSAADYRIVTYIDSAGCTPCRMKLQAWGEIINEFEAADEVDIDFLMIVNSPYNKDMRYNLQSAGFSHPVGFDPDRLFERANKLPSDNAYHTLLLDADNTIIAVGNPAVNPKIRDIYRRVVTGSQEPSAGSGLCVRPSVSAGAVYAGDTITERFELLNNRADTVTIQDLIPSCDCTYAESRTDTISPGATAEVTVTYIADTIAGPFKRYIDIYYHQQDNPERLTLHGYIIPSTHKITLKNQQQ